MINMEPNKQIEKQITDPKAQSMAIRNRRAKLFQSGSEDSLKNSSTMNNPSMPKGSDPTVKQGLTAQQAFTAGGFGNNLMSMNPDIESLIKPILRR